MFRWVSAHASTKLRFYSYFSFGSQPTYKRYLSQHITKIIETKPELYESCKIKFSSIVNQYQSQRIGIDKQLKDNELKGSLGCQTGQKIKSKLNMVFFIYSLPQILEKFKEQLSNMVIQNKINSKSELDKICNYLTKNIKVNKQIGLNNISHLINSQVNHSQLGIVRKQFDLALQELTQYKIKINIAEVSKILRQKFPNIESKQIYQRLKDIQSRNQQNKSEKVQQKGEEKCPKQFWDKINNIKPRLLSLQCNDPDVYKKHIQITQNRLRFRFPPEPNGYLHIGHIKSIRINFQTAKRTGGVCYLRYDDTNPETQSQQYIQNILNNVEWLGYKPDKITYASDYFQQMITFAIQLIKQGNAYVCQSTQEQIQQQRKQKRFNKYRDRQINESLSMFPNLKQGQTLRLKLDPCAKNPTLRDPIIYRIKNHAHPRTGNKYKIYPIYDFAHCICDSLQHIDYSLCSLQFQIRRQLYYTILDMLKLYKPSVWQYSRLNIQGSVVSKRKIKALITKEVIQNWSDPRLLTIGGLINRGYTPSMLIKFIDKVNASRAGNQNIIQFNLLQKQMRKQLYEISQKSMMVLKPRLLEIQDVKEGQNQELEVALYTKPDNKETRKILMSKRVYIQEQENIFEKGKIVILKYAGVFQIKEVVSSQLTIIKRLNKSIKQLKQQKLDYKVIHWISKNQGQSTQVILYDKLLNNQEINPVSKTVYKNSKVPKYILEQKQNTNKYWQMQRLGYFKFNTQGHFFRCTTLN